MFDLSDTITVLLATAPADRAAAEARVLATGLAVDLRAEIPVGDDPPDVIVVGAAGWQPTLAQLRAGFPFATRIVLAAADGPDLSTALRDGVHDVVMSDEPPRAMARSFRLGAYRARMEARFAEIRGRYRAAVRSGGSGRMRWDLRDRSMGFDPGWKAMLGYADDEHGDDSTAWFSRVHPGDQGALRARLRAALDGQVGVGSFEYRLQHRDGSWIWMGLRLRVEKQGESHYVLVGDQDDITVEKVSAQRVAWADRHDSLTGLLGRGAFIDDVQALLAAGQASTAVLAVCEVEGLKDANKRYGRAAGDEVLLWLAGLLEDTVGEGGLAARLTGDKFAFLLPDCPLETAVELAEGVRDELCGAVFLTPDGTEFGVEACLVVAAQPTGAEDAQAWLAAVNRAVEAGARARSGEVAVLTNDLVSGQELDGFFLAQTP